MSRLLKVNIFQSLKKLHQRHLSGYACDSGPLPRRIERHLSGYACDSGPLPRRIERLSTPHRSSREIREEFITFFKDTHQHTHVPSVSILPKKNEGAYFTNAGMTQFKPIFLDTVDRDSNLGRLSRAVNSQRCARIGGKHNDLDDVGNDTSHHTYFEMLGNWSFGNYYKAEVCAMMWNFLTRIMKLPADNLYVTYFEGCPELGLPPDTETRDIWLKLGVSDQRILRGSMKDNFWGMGETGPCGPCTEIHFDHIGDRCARCFVNAGSPEVVELWNAVFIQFNKTIPEARVGEGLVPLSRHFVDTGMGLERLTAVIQGVTSNYDTDLFSPIIGSLESASSLGKVYTGSLFRDTFKEMKTDQLDQLAQHCNIEPRVSSPITGAPTPVSQSTPPDANTLSRDRAYRIVADHLRLISACVADGLLPGSTNQEKTLRHVIHRALYHSSHWLGVAPTRLGSVVPQVIECMGQREWSGETRDHLSTRISQTLSREEELFLPKLESYVKAFDQATANVKPGETLPEEIVLKLINGKFASTPINFDLIQALSHDHLLSVDLPSSMAETERAKINRGKKDRQAQEKLADLLTKTGVLRGGDEAKYNYTRNLDSPTGYVFPVVTSRVQGIVLERDALAHSVPAGTRCSVLLEKTCFYAEAGGQAGDMGTLYSQDGQTPVFRVDKVISLDGFILHQGEVLTDDFIVDTPVQLKIDESHRTSLMRHHTAHHLLMHAISSELPPHDVPGQRGSRITHQKLSLLVSSLTDLTHETILKIEVLVNQWIKKGLPIHKSTQKYDDISQNPRIRQLSEEHYPSQVNVITVGDDWSQFCASHSHSDWSSAEICGGTHVTNTSDLIDFVVTSVDGGSQTVKEVSCVVGEAAVRARLEGEKLVRRFILLETSVSSLYTKGDAVEDARRASLCADQIAEIDKIISKITLPKLVRDVVAHKVDFFRQTVREAITRRERDAQKQALTQSLAYLLSKPSQDNIICSAFSMDNQPMTIKCIMECGSTLPVILYGPQKAICYVPDNFSVSSSEIAAALASSLKETHSLDVIVYAPKSQTTSNVAKLRVSKGADLGTLEPSLHTLASRVLDHLLSESNTGTANN